MEHNVREEGGAIVVAFKGEIDLEFSADVRTVLLDCVGRGSDVVVDMSEVELIDSSGVASLLEAFQNARKKGRDFTLAAVGETVLRVLKLARLDTVFNIVESLEEGLKEKG